MRQHIYFRGLNGLRFFAALAVMITHIELIKGQMMFEYLYESSPLVFELGSLGVIFFFVLSGFLITYLLLSEKERTGTIQVGYFYLRRVLRIWPLYFLIVALGFFALPHLDFMKVDYFMQFKNQYTVVNLFLFVLMLPNLAFAMYNPLPHIGQTWSIGVEEQFYLLWPLLVKRSKNLLRTLAIVILGLIAAKVIILLVYRAMPGSPALKVIKDVFAMFKIESMAIGGIGAWMVFEKKYYYRLLNNYILIFSIISIFLLIYYTPPFIQDAVFLVYSVLFLLLILNVALNRRSFLLLENGVFRFLGNISYGIYMYHMIVIAAVLGAMKYLQLPIGNSLPAQLVLYTASIGFSILIAWLSYAYFEKLFLHAKARFTIVKSGEAPENEKMPDISTGIPS